MLIPKRIQLEIFYGCNAKCIMCAISFPLTRKVGMMPLEMSKYIFDEFAPYTSHIEKVDLFGMGEPMLDEHLFDRITYAKSKGFRNIAISTNAALMFQEKQRRLLDTGIETIIFSIDGVKKETHEHIRKNLSFEDVVDNCESIIRMRDMGGYKTRFVVRFIRQKFNQDEWPSFRRFWGSRLSFEKNDLMILYDVNTMSGLFCDKKDIIPPERIDPAMEVKPCGMVFDRFIVLNNGLVPLCCEDTPKAQYSFGNINEMKPMDIFNSERWREIRQLHLSGERNRMKICRECTIPYCEHNQHVFTDYDGIDEKDSVGGNLEKG